MSRVISDSDDEEEVDGLGGVADATDAGNVESEAGEEVNGGGNVEGNTHVQDIKGVEPHEYDSGYQEPAIDIATGKPCVDQIENEGKAQSTGSTGM